MNLSVVSVGLMTKWLASIFCIAIVSTLLILMPVFSTFSGETMILNFGSISFLSALHVEGKYIKDSFGNVVTLSGVNKPGFEDAPGGTWMARTVFDYSQWRPQDVTTELDAMKTWGINVVRCHQAVENWKYDIGQHRKMFKEFLSLAGLKGIYVIYDGYSIRNYFNGSQQDRLPYPPYQTSSNASEVISSQEDFVNYWSSVAGELKGYANVIFELWNEPIGDDNAKQSWFNVSQRCINAIRSAGANQPIIFQWKMDSWINLDYSNGSILNWVYEANLTDPVGNLIYSTHIYPSYGAFHRTIPTYQNVWNYSEVRKAYQLMLFDNVTAQYPLIVGEIGANLALTGVDLQHDLEAFNNSLYIFNEMKVHYAAFWWRDINVFRLLENGRPWVPPPTVSGQILIDAIKNR